MPKTLKSESRKKCHGYHAWHVALNRFNQKSKTMHHWMYEAKRLAQEANRLPILFKKEREGDLPTIHKQCSLSASEKVIDNHLTCCLGVECRKCEHLMAIDLAEMPPEQKDEAKAWTCCSHILHECGKPGIIDTSEGYVLTVDDRMFWNNVYRSMSCSGKSTMVED
jgi:hypothetical protein